MPLNGTGKISRPALREMDSELSRETAAASCVTRREAEKPTSPRGTDLAACQQRRRSARRGVRPESVSDRDRRRPVAARHRTEGRPRGLGALQPGQQAAVERGSRRSAAPGRALPCTSHSFTGPVGRAASGPANSRPETATTPVKADADVEPPSPATSQPRSRSRSAPPAARIDDTAPRSAGR